MGGLLLFCKVTEPHRFLSCLRCLKHAWNCCLWVRSGFSLYLFFPMVIARMSGWVFPILPEDWLEISERNSELLRAELTVNIQLVFMTGLCRCYFFSSLLKKGELFSAWWNMIDICHHPCHAWCFTALQERQKRQILQVETAPRCPAQQGHPEQLCEGFLCSWRFFF